MPKYVIERDIPGAGKLSQEELKGISQTSCGVLRAMRPQIHWVQSYITGEKIYCIYIAPNEQMVRETPGRAAFRPSGCSRLPRDRLDHVEIAVHLRVFAAAS